MEHSDHIFISNEEYNKLQDIAAETEINGCRYCTTVEVLNQCDFYVIDPDGIDYLKKEHGGVHGISMNARGDHVKYRSIRHVEYRLAYLAWLGSQDG